MSGWRGKTTSNGHSSYNHNANRLRDKLESRSQSNNNDEKKTFEGRKRPPGLKGREIGLWYAQNQSRRSNEQRMVRSMNLEI